MVMQVNCVTEKGGAVELNKEHGVWASYAVATVADFPPSGLFYAAVGLPNGKTVKFFCNRETGLVTVDIADKGGMSGTTIVRQVIK